MSADAVSGRSDEACALVRAVGLDPAFTKRCIIDIDAEGVVCVYVEGYADVRHFEIQPPMPNTKARVFIPGENGPVEVTTHDDG